MSPLSKHQRIYWRHSNINKRFLKDLKLNTTNMCQVGWTHAPLFITGNRVEKVIMMLICLSRVNRQVLKIPTTLCDKLKSIDAEIHVQKWTDTFTRSLRKTQKPMKKKDRLDNVRSKTLQTVFSVVIMTLIS